MGFQGDSLSGWNDLTWIIYKLLPSISGTSCRSLREMGYHWWWSLGKDNSSWEKQKNSESENPDNVY